MTDFMDSIIASLNADVKKNNSSIFNEIQERETPRFLTDPTIAQHPVIEATRLDFKEQLTEIGQITKAYNKLKDGGESNKLSDSFRDPSIEASQSRTERSLTQTLASYSRYLSILQAST